MEKSVPTLPLALRGTPRAIADWGEMVGGERTVIRGGFSLRNFTEPQQYVWNQASDLGSFYYQSFFLNANSVNGPGAFAPGSLSIADFNPNATDPTQAFAPYVYGLSPTTFQSSAKRPQISLSRVARG